MKRKIYALVALLVITGCTNGSKRITETESLNNRGSNTKSQYTKVYVLAENVEYIHRTINDLRVINDSVIIVSTPNAIMKYDHQGNQRSIICKQGRGPQEFLSLPGVDISDSKMFAWCGNSQKILTYNIEGSFIGERKIGSMPNKRFCVYNDSLLCQYHTLPVGGDNIAIYNMNDGSKIWSTKLIKQEDELLNLAQRTGGMCIQSDSLFWICPSELSVYSVSLTSLSSTSEPTCVYSVHDSDFKIEKITNAREIINSNRLKAIEYINKNSRVVDLFLNEENICIAAEVGEIELTNNNILDNSNRKLKVYEIDRASGVVNAVELKFDSNTIFYCFNANAFYSVIVEENQDEPKYTLGYLELFD